MSHKEKFTGILLHYGCPLLYDLMCFLFLVEILEHVVVQKLSFVIRHQVWLQNVL